MYHSMYWASSCTFMVFKNLMLGYVLKVEAVSDKNGSADTCKLFSINLFEFLSDSSKNGLYAQKYIL